MKNIFPPEILKFSAENHYSRLSTRSQAIYLTVLAFLALSILSLFWLKADVTVLARGMLRSSAEPVQLLAPVSGEVLRTAVRENSCVNAGDTLIWIESGKLREKRWHLLQLLSWQKSCHRDAIHLLSGNSESIMTDLFRTTWAEYTRKVKEMESAAEFLYRSAERMRSLFKARVVPATELEEVEFRYEKCKEEMELYRSFRKSEWQKLAAEHEIMILQYEAEIRDIDRELERYCLLAPFPGHIMNYCGVQAGSHIASGQSLALLSPLQDLVAESYVMPEDMGYLVPGMKVQYQFDAYDHHLWGLGSGLVTDISGDIHVVNGLPCFRVRSSLCDPYLMLKNGHAGELRKGFTATVRFMVTRRTLARLLFEKSDKWFNPQVICP